MAPAKTDVAEEVAVAEQPAAPNGQIVAAPRPVFATALFQPANYIFRLDQFHIDNTRSVDEDTDHVTFGLKVGDRMYDPQTVHMGDVDNGDHAVGLQFGPILVDDPNTPIAFNYQVINAGHDSDANVEQKATAASIALAAKIFSLSTPWTAVLTLVAEFIFGILFADCDGPCAVDQVNVKGDALWSLTHGVGTWTQTKYYPGTDSDWGCGSNSEYSVTWSVIGAGVVPRTAVTALRAMALRRD